jgi:hypothetical protein
VRRGGSVFGSPDDLKLRSCATLFALVSPAGSVFHRLLDKYYGGEADQRTLELLDMIVYIEARAGDPLVSYEEMVKRLKADGYI